MNPLNYTLRSNFPGYLGKASSLAIEHCLDPADMEAQTQRELDLLCNLSRPESYDFGYRELQHNLGLTAEQMTWTTIFRACKIKKPASGTTLRAEAMKICLEASLAIAAERETNTTVRDNHYADRRVVDTRPVGLGVWVFCFGVVAFYVSITWLYWSMLAHL